MLLWKSATLQQENCHYLHIKEKSFKYIFSVKLLEFQLHCHFLHTVKNKPSMLPMLRICLPKGVLQEKKYFTFAEKKFSLKITILCNLHFLLFLQSKQASLKLPVGEEKRKKRKLKFIKNAFFHKQLMIFFFKENLSQMLMYSLFNKSHRSHPIQLGFQCPCLFNYIASLNDTRGLSNMLLSF